MYVGCSSKLNSCLCLQHSLFENVIFMLMCCPNDVKWGCKILDYFWFLCCTSYICSQRDLSIYFYIKIWLSCHCLSWRHFHAIVLKSMADVPSCLCLRWDSFPIQHKFILMKRIPVQRFTILFFVFFFCLFLKENGSTCIL